MQTSWQEVFELTEELGNVRIEYWLNETLFDFSWWILLITTLIPLVVWVIIVDKKRIFEIIAYGFIVTIIAAISDRMGVLLGGWQYRHTLTPLTTVVEIHVFQMPIIYMIIYQYFNKWKGFLVAITINAFVFTFVLEPLLVWLNIYELQKWKHIYSFFPYIILAVLCKWIVNNLKQNYE